MVTEQEQADKKVLMQEELLHRVHSKQVEREEAMEKTRRIKETLSEEVDPARQKAINMLLDTQNELLTVFGNVRVSNPSSLLYRGSISLLYSFSKTFQV